MIGKLPDLNPRDYGMEHSAATLAALTNLPYEVCMPLVCELDDVPTAKALTELVKAGITSQQMLLLYQAISQLEMMR